MINLKFFRNLFLILSVIVISFSLGINLGKKEAGKGSLFTPNQKIIQQSSQNTQGIDFTLFWKVWQTLRESYYDQAKLNASDMYYGAIAGMVSSLGDPYTTFLTPNQNKDTKDELGGTFEGIGAQLGFKEQKIVVVSPIKDTPADKAGIKAGDWILKINDKSTEGMTLPEAVKLIRGKKGTTVKLTLVHKDQKNYVDINVVRDSIFVKSVELSFNDNLAVLKLSRFGDTSNDEWDKAVDQVTRHTPSIKGVVLDLRNNPGGYLTGSVYIASEFIKSGVVVIQQEGSGNKQNYSVNRVGKLTNMPVVVLINQGSASASEIVTGALVDYGRAKTVGEKSFGKGTIQDAQDLDGGAGLHVTIAKWLTPKEKWINGTGIVPDYPVAMDEKDPLKDPQLDKALELLR